MKKGTPFVRFNAIGDEADVLKRLTAQLVNWFGTSNDLLQVALKAYTNTGVFNYSQLEYDQLQTRLETATEENLDIFAFDYFGSYPGLPRRPGEDDEIYRLRIKANLLLTRATRPAIDNVLFVLTGFHPILFEPWRPLDCQGGYNVPSVLNSHSCIAYATHGVEDSGHGSYGSGSYPYQGWIDVFLSGYASMGNRFGYSSNTPIEPAYYFGYNAFGNKAIGWYGNESLLSKIVTDQDIYQAINFTKAEGTICWVSIHRI